MSKGLCYCTHFSYIFSVLLTIHSTYWLWAQHGKEFKSFFSLSGLKYLLAMHFWTEQIDGVGRVPAVKGDPKSG